MKGTISQGGSSRPLRPKPQRIDFIRKWMETHDSFHIDGDGPELTAARRLMAEDATLALVPIVVAVGRRDVAGWRLERRAK